MASNQPPHRNDLNQVPSWDEFNMMAHEENENGLLFDGPVEEYSDENDIDEPRRRNLNENGLLLDGPVDEDSDEIVEPGHRGEYGPSLPPGFGADELNDGQPPFAENEVNNDFSAPFGANDLDLDDPEDPLQCSTSSASNSTNNQRNASRVIGPSIPSSMLPRIPINNRGDEHCLPSIGNNHHNISSDFIPLCDQPSSSNNINNNQIIGPTLPPDLNLPSNGQQGFPNINDFEDIGGPSLPPDEPQICSTSQHSNQPNPRNFRKKLNSFGPTLPSSSDEDEEEKNLLNEGNLAQIELNNEEGRDFEIEENNNRDDEHLIGPIPPVLGRSEEEEQFEYLARLAEFEANKKASNGLKREEWMTELPQKMLKTGAYGLSSKTSFSRSSVGPVSSDTSAWTSVPNGGQLKNTKDNSDNFAYDGPSTSSSSSSSNIPKPPTKRTEQDEWAEKRAAELNKERNESLLDIHQKKRKLESNNNKNGESSSGTKLLYSNNAERRPFNRDNDIEIRGLGKKGSSSSTDPASLKERVGDLSNRFGNNSDKKFL
ncbi:hypothetical protein ACQ4LE_006360 [Meloidogyne hapla]|uniref:DUF3752 domain-containing protein n=1 Tax=Meloidogyne hapla TaxID=6305 RepID=A0A1I8BL06_MELHA